MAIRREDVDVGRVDFSDIAEPGADAVPAPTLGETLRDVLTERNVSAYALAKAMGVPINCILAVLAGKRAVTADTAVRLGKALGTSADMWMTLQAVRDLDAVRQAWIGEDVRELRLKLGRVHRESPIG